MAGEMPRLFVKWQEEPLCRAQLDDMLKEYGLALCTAAERKVLEAMSAIPAESMPWVRDIAVSVNTALDAELARRGGA